MTTPISYKRLSTVLKRQGFLYRERMRDGNWAIYEQLRKGDEKRLGFEVVRIGRHNGFSIAGKTFPPAETYPTSSMWGYSGWTCSSYEAAVERMNKQRVAIGDAPVEIVEDESVFAEMVDESRDEEAVAA